MAYVMIVLTPKTQTVLPLRIGYETYYIQENKEPTTIRTKLSLENKAQLAPTPGRVIRPFNKEELNIINAGLILHQNIEAFIRHLHETGFTILYVSLKLTDASLYIDLIDNLNCVQIQKPTKRCLQKQIRRNRRFAIAGGESAFCLRKAQIYFDSFVRVWRRLLRTDRIKKRIYNTKKKD